MPNITSVRRLLALAGALLVLLGVVLLPLVVPAVLAAWAGQLLTIAGWTALVLAAGPFSARLVRPAIVLSARSLWLHWLCHHLRGSAARR
ncbi:MAG: hypothetical protein KatS3mg061_1199 [Dehalococcoidia bacterium]|nr:MAG: hypothetical protein KatS3mg061_1199 [Dehalococcoidia bacterium]